MCTTQGITFSALPWPKPAWPVQSGITETAASFSHATTTPLLSDLSHIKVLLSSTYHATKTPLFSDLSYKGTFFKYLSCYHNPTLFKLHMIVTIASTYHTSLVPKISDLMRPIHTKVPITSTCHATKHPMSSFQRKSHHFCPDAPDLGVIFDQDPLRLTVFIRGIVLGTMPLISSGALYLVRCLWLFWPVFN